MVCFFGLSHSIGCWLAPTCAGPMWNSLGPSLLALRGTPTPSPCLALPTIARVICVRRWSAQAWCSKHSPRAHKRAHVHANALPGGSACFHHDDLQAWRATSSRACGCSAWCAWRSWWRTRRPNSATAPTCAACAPPVTAPRHRRRASRPPGPILRSFMVLLERASAVGALARN